MSQRLSASLTFRGLEGRVSNLEADKDLSQRKILDALGYIPANIAGDAFIYVTARTFIASLVDAGGSANISAASLPGYTGIVEFRAADNTRSGFIGFNAEGGPMRYGSDTGAGHLFEGGIISPDPAMHFGLRFNGTDGVIDFDAGDLLTYDRAANKFYFAIGGVNVASIDAAGNLRIKGTLTQGATSL